MMCLKYILMDIAFSFGVVNYFVLIIFQRLFVEMEQMASRPFSQVLVEIEKRETPQEICSVNTLKKRKKVSVCV